MAFSRLEQRYLERIPFVFPLATDAEEEEEEEEDVAMSAMTG
jgi:hypothetical protein